MMMNTKMKIMKMIEVLSQKFTNEYEVLLAIYGLMSIMFIMALGVGIIYFLFKVITWFIG